MGRLRDKFKKWEKTALGLVAFLVVIPSVINAVGDVWASLQGLPIGEKEKINTALFKAHFKENPVASEQLTIEGDLGSLVISIDIYQNGDIFIDYGKYVQWFPFESETETAYKFGLINSAYAEWAIKKQKKGDQQTVNAKTEQIEHKSISNTLIERTRVLSDGSIEKQTININTGEVIEVESIVSESTQPMSEEELNKIKKNTINIKTLSKNTNDQNSDDNVE